MYPARITGVRNRVQIVFDSLKSRPVGLWVARISWGREDLEGSHPVPPV
jgi:hypothetical protein